MNVRIRGAGTCIVHDHIDPAETSGDSRDEIGRVLLLAQAGGDERGFGAGLLQLGEHPRALRRVTPGNGDARALRGGAQRYRSTNAGIAAGNENDFVLKPHQPSLTHLVEGAAWRPRVRPDA